MENLQEIYKGEEYEKRIESEKSALEIVPILYEIFCPKSVVDVGGGVGTWLEPFQKYENVRVCCVEGGYVRKNYRLNEDTLIEKDLEQRICLDQQFEMAISLEVAEHLSEKRADSFIDDLVELSGIIVFSAAVVFQPGDHHVNCKKSSYCKKLFEERHYKRIDCIRPLIASNVNIAWWYKNNIFIYVKEEMYEQICAKIKERNMIVWPDTVGEFIHYDCFYNIVEMQKSIARKEAQKKANILLNWMEFNKKSSIDEWIRKNLKDVNFAIFGLGDLGKELINQIQDKSNRDRLSVVIDNYTNENRWEELEVVTLPEFLALKNDVKVIISTLVGLNEEMETQIKNGRYEVIDIERIFE